MNRPVWRKACAGVISYSIDSVMMNSVASCKGIERLP